MSYFLHNPYLIWLLPLIGIPVLVHFLTRAKPPRYLFTATSFVRKVVQQTMRIKRPKDRILLLCRILIFLILCLIFCRPVLFFEKRLPGQDLPRNLVIIIDRSASMSWSEGGRSRFTAACDEAAILLEHLSSRDKANIVWIDRDPDAIFPEMGSNIAYLKHILREGKSTNENGNVELSVKLAISLLKAQPGKRELLIISDFQTSQWENFQHEIPADITVSTLWPARDIAENGAVLSIQSTPVSPLAGETAQIIISIGNFSDTPRNQTVIVTIDEKRVTRQIQVPAWGQGTVAIEHVFSPDGLATVSAQLEEDAFGIDDWRATVIPVRKFLQVGVIGEDPYTNTVFQRAFQALPWVSSVPFENDPKNSGPDYDLIYLSGWDGKKIAAISSLKEKKIPFLITPSIDLSYNRIADLIGKDRIAEDSATSFESLDSPVGMQINDNSHKIFNLFQDGTYGDPSQGVFSKRFHLEGVEQLGQTLLSFTDGKPAIIESKGSTKTILWFAPLAPDTSNWSTQVPFLPFFGEILTSMKNTKNVQLPPSRQPGEILSFKAAPTFNDVVLLDQSERTWPITRVDNMSDGNSYVSTPIELPGVYRLCEQQNCSEPKIVNFPSPESNLRISPPPLISQTAVRGVKHADKLQAIREGMPLWEILIWLALGFILLENLIVLLLEKEERKIAKGLP